MPHTSDPEQILATWLERDLSAEADALPAAYEVDAALDQVAGILGNGRSVLLVGDAGVGKSALVYELVRHLPELEGLAALQELRVVQLSIALRMSRLRKQSAIFKAFAALADALPALAPARLPFFRDGDLLHQLGLGPQLESLCLRLPSPLIVEGRPGPMNAMLETHEALAQQLVTVPLEEPSLPRALRIAERWASGGPGATGRRFEPQAVEEAVHLTHRFLSRARLPRKALDLLANAAAASERGPIGADAVLERFCRVHHTPRWLVDPALPLDLEALSERLRDALLGQEHAVDAALSAVALIKAGLSDPRRPFAVFLFVGPTGVGKTHLAQILAAELFGAADRMVRINLGDFGSARGAEALFGDPEHYLPANRRGVLTQRLMGQAFGVLLLDEFEKAHPAVHDRLLPLLDEGHFVNGDGERVSCRSCLVIATSNAGAEVYREHALGFTTPADMDARRDELERRVRQIFRFELLNRFDRVVHFQPLSREDIRALAARELSTLEQRPGLRRAGVTLAVDEAVLDWLAARGYDAQYGARFLKRTIEREITSAVADVLARGAALSGGVVELDLRRGRVRARLQRSATPDATRSTPRERCAASTDGLPAAALIERAHPRLCALDRDVAERDRLLADMSVPELWEDAERRTRLVERFRTLDVAVRVSQRFARPIARLRDEVAGGVAPSAQTLEQAATALRRWEDRERVEGDSAIWMLLSALDPDAANEDWLRDLARALSSWCRRLELRVTPIAFELRSGGVLARLALEVEGPGAEHFLESERGVHRRRRGNAADSRVRVDLVTQGSDGFGVDVRDRALQRGPFGLIASLEAVLSLPHTGQTVTLLGASRASLAGLVGDLEAAWSGLRADSPELARSYGEPGGRVLDPRTGASASQRAVMRGQFDPFLDGWRGAQPPP